MSGKSLVWLLAVIALVAALWYRTNVLSDPVEANFRPQLAIVTGGSGPFWQLVGNGAKAAAGDHNIDLEFKPLEQDEDIDLQSRLLLGLDLDQLDGVALSPLDAEGQTPLINRIAEKAFVITFDSDAPLSDRASYVGTSNVSAGRTCASLVKEAIPDGGKLAVILANLTKQNMVDRKSSFEEAISQAAAGEEGDAPSFEVVDYMVDDGDEQQSVELIQKALVAHPDLKCLVGMNAQHGPILLRVLREEGKLGDIKLVTFDEAPETLDGIEAGDIFATVAQDPYQYGYQAVQALVGLCRVSEAQRPLPGSKSTLTISLQPVRQDNLAEFRKQLESRLAAP